MSSNNENVKRAREFAKRTLEGERNDVEKEDYIMFLLSKFVLLKENIIKKNIDENILYFDYEKNYKYLNAIKYIVDYVRKNGILISNNIEVIILPENLKVDESLKAYIRDFHKIRDSIAHGKYQPDAEKGLIKINNTNIKENEPKTENSFDIKIDLPIEILEIFEYIISNPKEKYSEEEIDNFNKQIETSRKKYKYDYSKINKNIINKEYYEINNIINKRATIDTKKQNKIMNNQPKDNLKQINNIINKEYYETNNIINKRATIDVGKQNKIMNNQPKDNLKQINNIINKEYYEINNIINKKATIDVGKQNKIMNNQPKDNFKQTSNILNNKDTKYIIKEYEKILEEILDCTRTSNSISENKKQKILYLLSKYKLLKYDFNKNTIVIKRTSKPEDSVVRKLKVIIDEIAAIIGINKEENSVIEIPATYNYLQILLSTKEESIEQSPADEKSLGKLKISKLNPKYLLTDSQADVINKKIKLTTKKIRKMINQYINHKTIEQREYIMIEFKRLNEELFEALIIRNKEIIASIRNSIEHGNIEPQNGDMKLYDQTDPKDEESTNFTCKGSPKDFLEVFEKIELQDKNDDFSYKDFLHEIEYILQDKYPQTFSNFISIIEEIRKINEEALLDILKMNANKKR